MGAKKDLHLRYQIYNKKKNMNEVKERDVDVDIPAGIDNGMNLRLSGHHELSNDTRQMDMPTLLGFSGTIPHQIYASIRVAT